MAAKTGTWLIAVGSLIAFVGLCFMPAAFGPDTDRTMLCAGAVLFSTGLLLIAGALYIKARSLGGAPAANSPAPGKRPRKANCDRCGKDEPVIQCRVHQIHLCGDCLTEHYDFRSCAYVPSTRRGAAKPAAYSQASSA
ncbi:MAG: hypothetical protein HY233_06240 [Acidobacteriales bacterium]|nr:hypothetical protein [Terriglobales bacterium]